MRLKKRMMKLASERTFKDEFYYTEEMVDTLKSYNIGADEGVYAGKLNLNKIWEQFEYHSEIKEKETTFDTSWNDEEAQCFSITVPISNLVKDENNINPNEMEQLKLFLEEQTQNYEEMEYWINHDDIEDGYSLEGVTNSNSYVEFTDKDIIFTHDIKYQITPAEQDYDYDDGYYDDRN